MPTQNAMLCKIPRSEAAVVKQLRREIANGRVHSPRFGQQQTHCFGNCLVVAQQVLKSGLLETMGLLLPETWRMHPSICDLTSQLFYDGRLGARDFTKHRILRGHPWLNGAGLWFVPVAHEGNRNSSPEEIEVIAKIVESLLQPGVVWFRNATSNRPIALKDILIVAPYNAQVSDLLARLPPGANVGTVDKFQGQEAPIVIYSLTTSSPEDAPRGMEFLYSLNRLNVATSRA